LSPSPEKKTEDGFEKKETLLNYSKNTKREEERWEEELEDPHSHRAGGCGKGGDEEKKSAKGKGGVSKYGENTFEVEKKWPLKEGRIKGNPARKGKGKSKGEKKERDKLGFRGIRKQGVRLSIKGGLGGVFWVWAFSTREEEKAVEEGIRIKNESKREEIDVKSRKTSTL